MTRLEEAGALDALPSGEVEPCCSQDELEDAVQRAAQADEHRHAFDRSRVEMMRAYAEHDGCRREFILSYFGEDYEGPCGNCDNCDAGLSQQQPDDDETPFPAQTPVQHAEWGPGVVMRVEDDRLVVLFEEVGYKTLALAAVVENDLLRPRAPA